MYERYGILVRLEDPPLLWRLIGRRYWKGWRVYVADHITGLSVNSDPALEAPTPQSVARATAKTILELQSQVDALKIREDLS